MTTAIPALTALRPIEARLPFASGLELQLGELLKLNVAAGADGALLGRDARGLEVALPGGAELAQPGDVLLMRVMDLRPRLALQLVERQPQAQHAVEAGMHDESSPALRTDQAWLARQHLSVAQQPLPDPARVAVQWRAQVFDELQRAAPGEMVAAGAALQDEGQAPPGSFRLVGWQDQALLLSLLLPGQKHWAQVTRDGRRAAGGDVQAEEISLLLCIALTFEGDWVQVLLQWDHGVHLHFTAGKAETLARVRGLLPRIATALAAVPLRLRSCQLSVRRPGLEVAPPPPESQRPGTALVAEGISGTLFRAAAELAKVLQLAQPREPMTEISR